MIRKLACVAAVAGLALLIAAPATGRLPVGTGDDGAAAASRAQALEKLQQALDSRSRELNVQASTTGFPPDAIDRALTTQRPVTVRAIDDHFRYDPAGLPKPAPVTTSSGNDVEWPQIGIGLGIGVLLMLGVGLVLRFTRTRQLAH